MKRQSKFINSENIQSLEYIKNESVELFLTYCGYEIIDEGYQVNFEKRNDYLLCIVTNGQGTLIVNNNVYSLKNGSAFVIFPGMEGYFDADAGVSCSYSWIGFSGVKADECVRYSGFSQKSLFQTIDNTEHLCAYIKRMLEVRDMTFANELKRNGLLKLFFSDFIEQYDKQVAEIHLKVSHGGETSAYIRNAISYISENYSSNIKINELADYIGVNRSYLASSFKKATGYSPKEYLLCLRMEKAKTLLEKTDMPINSIANSVGYTDQLAFSRMFKRYSGVSPRAYREDDKE